LSIYGVIKKADEKESICLYHKILHNFVRLLSNIMNR